MSTQPKALRLADALDAEFVQGRISNSTGRKSAVELRRLHEVNQDLLKALHEALETEQKPVAWISEGGYVSRSKRYMDEMGFKCNHLYTAPPKKQWVGLTDQEIGEVISGQFAERNYWVKITKALESKLKEKNT